MKVELLHDAPESSRQTALDPAGVRGASPTVHLRASGSSNGLAEEPDAVQGSFRKERRLSFDQVRLAEELKDLTKAEQEFDASESLLQ